MVGLVRSVDTWGVNSMPLQKWMDAGVGVVLFEVTWGAGADLAEIGQAIKNVRAKAGLDAGIWFQSPDQSDAKEYAADCHDSLTELDRTQANPHLVMLDLEARPLVWMRDAVIEYRRLRPTRLTCVTCEPGQDSNVVPHETFNALDMDYYVQSYGAVATTDHRDPMREVGRTLQNGFLPLHRIHVLVSTGLSDFYVPRLQMTGTEGFGLFVLDDMTPTDYTAYKPLVGGSIPGGYSAFDRRRDVRARAA